MRRLLLLVVLVILLFVADIAVRTYAEDEIERRARAGAGGSATVDASIDSFPFVPRLLASGAVGDVDVVIDGFSANRLRVASLRLTLDDVRVDEERLRADRAVRVRTVEQAAVVVELRAEDLAEVTGLPLTIEAGKVRLSTGGRSVALEPRLTTNGSLEFRGAPQAALVPGLSRTGLSGCSPGTTEVRADRLRVSCRTDDVPPVLLGPLPPG